jgi:uncharacterized protein (DUF305 family)
MSMHRPSIRLILSLAAVSAVLAACGGGDEETAGTTQQHGQGHSGSTTTTTPASTGAALDRAFIADMIPHHESAVEMAEIALERGESDFVKNLAQEIIKAQNTEISTMRRIDESLADEAEVGDLGVADHMKGMDQDIAELREAKDFDAMFIEMMIPHHEGAIEMAKVELAKGTNDELKKLAQDIVDAQTREIKEMQTFEAKDAGANSNSGGKTSSMTSAAKASGSGNKAHVAAEEE